MVNVQIRDVPESVHEMLVRRAEAAGQSLQQYLTGELTKLAARPTVDEVLARVEARSNPSITADEILEALDEGRAGR